MQILDLDISKPNVSSAVFAKQGDVGRKFCVHIFDSGEPFLIPDDCALSVWYSGTSGMGNYSSIAEHSAFSVTENQITVELISQMLENKGGGTLCIVLNRTDGSQLGVWNLPYTVEPVPGLNSPSVQNYYTALSEIAANAASIAQRIEHAAQAYSVDETLTHSGQAADAKVVGNLINQLLGKYQYFSTFWWNVSEDVPIYEPIKSNWSTIPNGCFAAHMVIDGVAYGLVGYKHGTYGVSIVASYAFSVPYMCTVRNVNDVWSIRKVTDGGAA